MDMFEWMQRQRAAAIEQREVALLQFVDVGRGDLAQQRVDGGALWRGHDVVIFQHRSNLGGGGLQRLPSKARWPAPVRSRIGGRRTRNSGIAPAVPSPDATCGSPSPACCCRSRSGWCGRWWWQSCPRLGSRSPTSNCSGSRHCPGLSGATLRVVYAFMPAIFGGRMWTTLTTWSLLIPAVGMGFAVQSPDFAVLDLPVLLRCFAGWAAAISPPRWPTSRSSSPRPRKAARWPSTRVSAISASVSCSSWCRWRSPPACSAGLAEHRRPRSREASQPRCGCKMPASSSCRSSPPALSRPGSA